MLGFYKYNLLGVDEEKFLFFGVSFYIWEELLILFIVKGWVEKSLIIV